MENDKIIIACDDDLKFFMEESACHKLTFDFHPAEVESSRKRSSSQIADDVSEYSKKIRKQLQNIDLDTDSSSMDTDDDDDLNYSSATSKNSSNVSQDDEIQPSTSEPVSSSSNVRIISVDIIKPAEQPIVIPDENGNEVEEVIEVENVREDSSKQEEKVQKSCEQKKQTETNRILISDSSDDETQEGDTNNNSRRFSDGPSASAYSFAGVGDTYDSRTSHESGRHHRFRRGRRHRGSHGFQEAAREFQRAHSENMERFHENARMAREQAARAVRASASAIPDILSTFQAHFRRPLFHVSDINQQLFGSFGRR